MLNQYEKSDLTLATAAFNEIVKFNTDRECGIGRVTPPRGMVYHYTNADGLKGIIEKNQLWATSAYFLNDSTEIVYGYELLKDLLDDWLAKKLLSRENSLSQELAKNLKKGFGGILLNRQFLEPIYLACFCEDDNLLSQWRAYGPSGGYSLGFTIPDPDLSWGQGFRPEPSVFTSKWVKVVYEREEQVRGCRAVVDRLLSIFEDSNRELAVASVRNHPKVGYQAIMTAIFDILLDVVVSFKNEAFSSEKEWRLVVRRRELGRQSTDDVGKAPADVHFRSLKGTLVPYVKVVPRDADKKLPIASVRSGPTFEKTAARMAVSMMLTANGYSDVEVYGSDIPVKTSL